MDNHHPNHPVADIYLTVDLGGRPLGLNLVTCGSKGILLRRRRRILGDTDHPPLEDRCTPNEVGPL
jgi:hypothetical protein